MTANRRSESISKVPSSVLALDQKQMDARGVKTFADVTTFSPGVTLTPSATGGSNVSIRGVSSTAGAATTGVYIDNTPTQVRAIGYSPSNSYPIIFDLNRVEVLRGPQGTLFGAGSEGGTIRFIQTEPSLTTYSVYGRTEVGSIKSGGTSYEAGVAAGGPIITDKLGFRASVYYRRDGGYIDYVNGSFSVVDPTGAAGPQSTKFNETGIADKNANWGTTKQARLALKWAATDDIMFTPSVTYQDVYKHESINAFFPSMSNYSTGDLKFPQFVPTVDATHLPINAPLNQPSHDKFLLPALNATWNMGPVELISDTAYYRRRADSFLNSYGLYDLVYGGFAVPQPGNFSTAEYINRQNNFTQELRLQPSSGGGRLNWVAGLFYQHSNQYAAEPVNSNFISLLPQVYGAFNNGSPFGAGTSAYVNWFGENPLNGTETWFGSFRTIDQQYAAYGQVDYSITHKLKITLGGRLARVQNRFEANYSGPENNLTAPQGSACTTVGGCTPGQGAYAVSYLSTAVHSSETAFTPKALVSYQADRNNMVYASATKGFRPGGGEAGLAPACAGGLSTLGYTDGNGKGTAPESYKSDSVWSYEAGAKGSTANHFLRYSVSAYLLKWKNIQSSVFVNTCFQSFVTNLQNATGRGFDLDLQIHPITPLTLGFTAAYNKTTFDSNISPGGATVYSRHSAVPDSGAPWHITVSGDYTVPFGRRTEGYFHGDYIYTSRLKPTGSTDPLTVSYDPLLAPIPSTGQVNLRAGVRFHELDLSAFVTNAANSLPHLALTRGAGTIVWTDATFQPRTIGLTAAVHY